MKALIILVINFPALLNSEKELATEQRVLTFNQAIFILNFLAFLKSKPSDEELNF